MTKTIKARYRNGRIELLEPVEVEEGSELLVTLTYPIPQALTENPTTATAGAWKDLLDCQQFEKEVYQNRRIQTRPEVRL